MSDRFTKLLHYILPSFLLEHFDLSDIQEIDGILHITLEELHVVPAEFAGHKLLSKGFFKNINVQDFPIRGQRVYLKIKRRRWMDTDTGKVVCWRTAIVLSSSWPVAAMFFTSGHRNGLRTRKSVH